MSGGNGNYFALALPRCGMHERLAIVDRRSSPSRRRAVERIARFFQREGSYDFIAYEADDPGETRAVLFAANYFEFALQNNLRVAACCFDREGRGLLLPEWCLAWVRCHPYLRGGLDPFLPRTWWDLCTIIDSPFFVDPPLSPAMGHGLMKMGYDRNMRGYFLCGKDFPLAVCTTADVGYQGIAPERSSGERSE